MNTPHPSLGHRLRQRGAALLAAMLTVTLVATFASAAMWQQWRTIEIETAERARVQSAWILIGALDWSRLILYEDLRSGSNSYLDSNDHLAEPWAVPLEEARLSSFLAADQGVTQQEDASTDTTDAFLSGQIIDLQARLNLANLVDKATVNAEAKAQFARLFARLGLAPGELDTLTEALRQAQDSDNPNAPLAPPTLAQLTWLGVAPATVAALARPATPRTARRPARAPALAANAAQRAPPAAPARCRAAGGHAHRDAGGHLCRRRHVAAVARHRDRNRRARPRAIGLDTDRGAGLVAPDPV